MIKISSQKGYIAVTSAIVIAVVLMAIVFSVSYTGFLNRFNILESYTKEVGRSMAEACINEARLKLAENILYVGNEIITIGADTCTIFPIEDNLPGLQKTIKSKSIIKSTVTNLKVVINTVGLSIVSWEEIETL